MTGQRCRAVMEVRVGASVTEVTQRIHVGVIHARKIVTVTAADDSFRISLDSEVLSVVPRATTREIHRYKACGRRAGGTR